MVKNNKRKKTGKSKVLGTQSDEFYVGVSEPALIRKEILDLSKEMVKMMQQYERIKAIRMEKEETIAKIKRDSKMIGTLIRKLKKILPKTKLRIRHVDSPKFICELCEEVFEDEKKYLKHFEANHKKKMKKVEKRAKRPGTKELISKKQVTELDELEHELGQIEEKLKIMN